MPSLIIIAAVASNGVIGVDNKLPWRLPEDLRHFRALTRGHTVIMGRRTWESLPENFRPLPERTNIVVTRDPAYRAAGAMVASSLAGALAGAGSGDVFVIGGAQLFGEALALAERLELTEIAGTYAGDAYFPEFDRRAWCETARAPHRSETGLDYAFVTYQRCKD